MSRPTPVLRTLDADRVDAHEAELVEVASRGGEDARQVVRHLLATVRAERWRADEAELLLHLLARGGAKA